MIVTRVVIGAGLLVWVGATLLLSQWARLARPRLVDRLRPLPPGRRRHSADARAPSRWTGSAT